MRLRIKDIRNLFIDEYKQKNFIQDKSGIKTIEILAASFIADEPFIFGQPNENYIQRELNWYNSMSLNINDIGETIPKMWKNIADVNGFINSNYGWCINSSDNYNQYENCKEELIKKPFSRRATMIYNRPSMWVDYNRNGMNDFMCTYAAQFFIRNDKLYSYVLMRSNDAWAGYRNDYAWHNHVHTKLSNDLNIDKGFIYWTSGSLHLYEKQFYLIDEYLKNNHIT